MGGWKSEAAKSFTAPSQEVVGGTRAGKLDLVKDRQRQVDL